VLAVDDGVYSWVTGERMGVVLVTSHHDYTDYHILATGYYRLYDVKSEPGLSPQQHLELNVGYNLWQGYLLPSGLPNKTRKLVKIMPTKEVVSVKKERAGLKELQRVESIS
jgi:hypothetical protein